MKTMKLLSFIVITLLAISLCSIGATASTSTTGSATISFYSDTSPPGPGGSGGGTNTYSSNRGSGTDAPNASPRSETVTVLKPDVPLTILPELPKTGSDIKIPLLLIVVGGGFVIAAKLDRLPRIRTMHI